MRKLPRSHYLKMGEQYMAGRSIEDIAKTYGVTKKTMYQYLARQGVFGKRRDERREQMRAKVKELYEAGHGITQIAGLVGVSYPTVSSLLRGAGIDTSKRRGSYLRSPCRRPDGKPSRILQVVARLLYTNDRAIQIAKDLNVSREYVGIVQAMCRDAGIKTEGVSRAA